MDWKCNKCQRGIVEGTDTFYDLLGYHEGDVKPTGEDKNWIVCQPCYQVSEQEYLQNYRIIAKTPREKGENDYIKYNSIECYAGKKDKNGKILQQQNCTHCQPWKQHNKDIPKPTKICSVCGKDITKQEITYSSKYSGGEKKDFCSVECLQSSQDSTQKPLKNNNNENKGLSIEMKVFLGIAGAIIVNNYCYYGSKNFSKN